MCLLLTQQSTTPALTDKWLADFFSYNSDGVGVMRSEQGQLIVEKTLPKTADEFIHFYRTHIQGFDCAWHLRMRTHGATDLLNCHPYEVLNESDHGISMWLMHNGILHTGNKADTSKSDTYHYIADYLRPMLSKNPDFAFTNAFHNLIGDHIGASNKFVLMDNHNRMAVINESEGVYWGGLWLSNEYAWSASKTTSKKPEYDHELHYQQVAEIPEDKWTVKSYASDPVGYSYSYNYHDGEYYDRTNYANSYTYSKGSYYDQDTLDTIDIFIDDLFNDGYIELSQTPLDIILEFCDRYNPESFYDLAGLVLDKRLPDYECVRCFYDYDYAEEYFPWLVNEKARAVA